MWAGRSRALLRAIAIQRVSRAPPRLAQQPRTRRLTRCGPITPTCVMYLANRRCHTTHPALCEEAVVWHLVFVLCTQPLSNLTSLLLSRSLSVAHLQAANVLLHLFFGWRTVGMGCERSLVPTRCRILRPCCRPFMFEARNAKSLT